MVKLIYCISKKPEMSVEQFQTYWRETHAPIAAAIPGLRRYVQCHVVPELYARQAPPYDGAAELWFDDLDAMRVGDAIAGDGGGAGGREELHRPQPRGVVRDDREADRWSSG